MSKSNRSPAKIGIEERVDSAGRAQFRGTVYDRGARRHLRGPWTYKLAEARAWRNDALGRVQQGTLTASRGPRLAAVADAFLAGIESGAVRTRSGDRYKPSSIAGYKREMRARILPAFGGAYLRAVTLPDVQRWADKLATEGLSPSTIRNVIVPLRALYTWALPRGLARVNPTRGLQLPTGETKRDRVATREEAARLIAALRPLDQAALGLAVYGGLRLGELLALEWSAIDLASATLRVERSWDPHARRFVEPKSKAGRRTVPIAKRLHALLSDHRVLTDHRDGLLFPGQVAGAPVHPTSLRARVGDAWEASALEPLGFHEARHTFASLMIAAGVNAKALSTFMGHASITITLDRYGHLFPGSEDAAGALLDVYLTAAADE